MAKLSELLCPKARCESLVCVDPQALRDRGIGAIILDLDNTLVLWGSSEIVEEVREWVRRAREMGLRLAVASNTHRPRRLAAICEELGIDVVQRALKPRRAGLRKAMEAMESRPETTALVGDQLFTDVLGGNRLGLFTVLLNPLSPHEFIGTRANRFVERLALHWLARRGVLPKMWSCRRQ